MKDETVYLVGIHRYSFRAGEATLIIGVQAINDTICYWVKYEDGELDHIPISDNENYQLITYSQKQSGRIPKVTQ